MIRRVWKTAAMAAAVLLIATGAARASPIVNPDLTASDLVIAFDGTNLNVGSPGGSVLSWTNPDGTFGGASLGTMNLSWNGSSGTFSVYDDLASTLLLSGDVFSLYSKVFGPGAIFKANVLLSTNLLGFGDRVSVLIGSTNFTFADGGVGQADITSVPEPATLAMFLLGGGYTAARRWRKTRPSTTPRRA